MKYKEWKKIYEEIILDFGYDKKKDEEAAIILSKLIKDRFPEEQRSTSVNRQTYDSLRRSISGREIAVCGNAPSLESDIRDARLVTRFEWTIMAADGATSVLINSGIIPDIIVTDLDGTIGDILYANRLGAIVVVHAHGDNIEELKKVVPQLSNVIGTTQTEPLENVHNFGGFTDGDRCVFIANEFSATRIELFGFDFEDPTVDDIKKKKKLKWAEKLIEMVLNE
jgi:hypothetical protein